MYMRSVLLAFGIIQVIILATSSLKLDSSGWRTISKEPSTPSKNRNGSEEARIIKDGEKVVSKKLVEWDDDDILNDLKEDAKLSNSIESEAKRVIIVESKKLKGRREKQRSRLIYHGQVRQSEGLKLIDGLKLHINTREPVSINRRSFSAAAKLKNPTDWVPENERFLAEERPLNLSSPSSGNKLDLLELRSSSDWKPITFTSSARSRRSKLKIEERKESNTSAAVVLNEAGKWKPISSQQQLSGENEERRKKKATDAIVYGKKSTERELSINEPFDVDDGIIVAKKEFYAANHSDVQNKHQREGKAFAKSSLNLITSADKWKPVDATTQRDYNLDLLTTTEATNVMTVSNASLSANNSASSGEAAHRSASDLNYIYSSQPVNQAEAVRQPASYYSNYVVQPQAPVEQPQSIQDQQVIIDTTSGQAPEMIAERIPEQPAPQVVSSGEYSLPQTSASFQPMRTPYQAGYNQDAISQQPVRQPAQAYQYGSSPQPTRQAQPAPQVLKQEHHYHYYNNQQGSQQAERQLIQAQQPQTQVQSSVQNVIREIQPLLISQPIIQQQASTTTTTTSTTTTPAPQIIREIIKEVPVQTMQLAPFQMATRLLLPQQATQIPVQFAQATRDLDSPISYAATLSAPAQRVIRQLTNSIPSVSVRIPPVPQIRLPFQALQPVRIGALTGSGQSVTRQTGSFVIPPVPKKTTTYLTETQAMPTHTTIMHTTQFTPATRTTVYTTDHQTAAVQSVANSAAYKR